MYQPPLTPQHATTPGVSTALAAAHSTTAQCRACQCPCGSPGGRAVAVTSGGPRSWPEPCVDSARPPGCHTRNCAKQARVSMPCVSVAAGTQVSTAARPRGLQAPAPEPEPVRVRRWRRLELIVIFLAVTRHRGHRSNVVRPQRAHEDPGSCQVAHARNVAFKSTIHQNLLRTQDWRANAGGRRVAFVGSSWQGRCFHFRAWRGTTRTVVVW